MSNIISSKGRFGYSFEVNIRQLGLVTRLRLKNWIKKSKHIFLKDTV